MYRPNRGLPSRNVQMPSTPSTISVTQGTPRRACRAVPRSALPISTTTTPAAAMVPIFSAVTLIGGGDRPAARRCRSRTSSTTAASATITIITIQPATGLRLPSVRSPMILLLIGMEPPGPWPLRATRTIIRPCRPSRPARVTTNDGNPSPGDQQAEDQADERPGPQPEDDREPPRHAEHGPGGDDRGHGAGEPDG